MIEYGDVAVLVIDAIISDLEGRKGVLFLDEVDPDTREEISTTLFHKVMSVLERELCS